MSKIETTTRPLRLLAILIFTLLALSATGAMACKNGISDVGWSTDTNFYTYRITEKKGCGFLSMDCCNSSTTDHKVPIGLGDLPSELKSQFHSTWPDGCSGTIEGDGKVWKVACHVHDAMFAIRPPEGVDSNEWRLLADNVLMLNMAAICLEVWPTGSPGLGGCFDGAKNTYNILGPNGFSRDAFGGSQKWSERQGIPRLSQANYDRIKKAVDDKMKHWPIFVTSWNPGSSILAPN